MRELVSKIYDRCMFVRFHVGNEFDRFLRDLTEGNLGGCKKNLISL